MTTLIIARHGNTFDPDETPRRVGAATDLPLVEKGREQAQRLGEYLKQNSLVPDVVYSSALMRTQETAKIAIKAAGYSQPVYALDIFNEIDYGPDENKTEDEVVARLGEQALADWDEKAIVPEGWRVSPDEVIKNWCAFADQIRIHDDGETVLVVTSNGIARFAPHITGDFETFAKDNKIKISTGALCIFEHGADGWAIKEWNVKP